MQVPKKNRWNFGWISRITLILGVADIKKKNETENPVSNYKVTTDGEFFLIHVMMVKQIREAASWCTTFLEVAMDSVLLHHMLASRLHVMYKVCARTPAGTWSSRRRSV